MIVLGTGYVASAYLRAIHSLGYFPLVLSRAWLDYTDRAQLEFVFRCYKPDLVIDATGFTGVTVDDCEKDRTLCYHANSRIPLMIAQECAKKDIKLIHIGSGCIFNGPGPFKEEDEPNVGELGGRFYATCKWFVEKDITALRSRAYQFRIRMPFSHLPHPRNWLWKLAQYPQILDGVNSVTFIDEFAMRSFQLVEKAPPGIYHAAGPVPVRTWEVAKMLTEAGIRKYPMDWYDPDKFLDDHVARSAAVLDVSKFEKAYGAAFGDPMVAIRWCIENFGVVNASRT